MPTSREIRWFLRYPCRYLELIHERKSDFRMIKIKARGTESVNQMLKRFKKACEKEGLTKDIKRNSYYEKPSEQRRRQMRKSIKRVTKVSRY